MRTITQAAAAVAAGALIGAVQGARERIKQDEAIMEEIRLQGLMTGYTWTPLSVLHRLTPRRVNAALHVLRGRPLAYRMTFRNPFTVYDKQMLFTECVFTGSNVTDDWCPDPEEPGTWIRRTRDGDL